MRTRFLATDYFTSSSSPIENLDFLNLPVPHVSPSRLSTCKDDDLLCFDSVIDISLEIEQLPIHSALSKFFSEVIPQPIDIDCRDFEALYSQIQRGCDDKKESDIFCEEKEEEGQRDFGSETVEKDNETDVDDKNTNRFEVIHFETPEPAVLLENVSIFNTDEILILPGVSEIDNNQDMLKPGLAIQYSNVVQESVYSVEDVALDYHIEQKTCISEDDGSFQDQVLLQCCKFPLLEVDEISLGTLTSQSMEDELHAILENMEHQHWNQTDYLLINNKEILGSMDYDILDFLSDHNSSKHCLESELASMDTFHEIDFVSMVESSQLKESSKLHVMADGDCLLSMSPLIFQEFEFFEGDSSQFCEVFFSAQSSGEPVTCAWMFGEDMNFKNFDELIISHELTLIDETFKSLPIPVLSDHDEIRSIYAVMEQKLADLKPLPLSASDGIYLDWHLLEDDKYSSKLFCSHHKMLEEIESYNIGFHVVSSEDEKLVDDFIFSDDALSGQNMEAFEESLNVGPEGMPKFDCHLMEVSSDKSLYNGSTQPGNGGLSGEESAEKASLLFKSKSQLNDLDFFLNQQKAITVQKGETAVKEFDTADPSSSSKATCVSTDLQLQQWDVILYEVKLSDNILALINIFEKSYLAILLNETELNTFVASDNSKSLSLRKEKLMDYIDNKMFQKASCDGDENIMAFATLCAIKQMAWYTCFYGIHTARLYVDKLCKSLDCLKSRLGSLQSLIVGADGNVDKEITGAHPSLLVIQRILQSNTFQSNSKVMILAEQVFWWSLKCLVISMGFSCNELPKFCRHVDQPDFFQVGDFTNAKMDDLLISDCLLVSHESLSASFPFSKFGLILEYGGSYGSSRISNLCSKLAGLPHLHFLKVELENSSARALCEGVGMPQNIGMSHCMPSVNENMSAEKLRQLLNFVPIEDRYHTRPREAVNRVEACCMPPSVPCLRLAVDSEQVQKSMASHPDAIIIVNTQNMDKEMIVSRRSTYQRILAMEKEGVQVVERDSNMPVDIIISSSICLVWYDCGNIGKKATALDEASSCLPLCVENIATNVLTLLSFTFSTCILVFEGQINFISTVMESSDGLYAAAASLGLDIQIFCSYSSDLTDEIILNCIGNSIKLTRGLCPKMSESETLAESFLTQFPSVNPLTAHSMLSSVGMLIDLLQYSHDYRIAAIQKFYVPIESINLFSTLCKYGEREDSKSIMTDCSSSVSSGPDSDTCRLNIDSERKQQKCIFNPHKIDVHADDLLHFEPLNQFTDGLLNPSGVSKPYDCWKDPEIFGEHGEPSSSLNDLFGKKQELDFDIMMKPSTVKPYDSQILEGPQILNEINDPKFSLKDKLLGQNQGSEFDRGKNLDWHNMSKSSNLQEDFIGEVIDLTCSPLSGKKFCSVPKSSSSPSVPEMEDNSTRKSKIARRLSFGKSSHPTFPTAAEINCGPDVYSSKDPRHSSQGTNDLPQTDYRNDNLPLEQRKNLLEEVLERRFAGSKGLPFQEEISHYSGTPLSNAIHSANPQPGSPWTIEFLNRVREKSRLRQQSLSCDTAAPYFGVSGNISKVTKRRSPSILEFFKYQGGSSPGNLQEQKKQKRSIQSSSSSKNKVPSTSFLPTWTPSDKRARQTLSFAMNKSGSQTKLVWSDGNAHGLRKKFQNQ